MVKHFTIKATHLPYVKLHKTNLKRLVKKFTIKATHLPYLKLHKTNLKRLVKKFTIKATHLPYAKLHKKTYYSPRRRTQGDKTGFYSPISEIKAVSSELDKTLIPNQL